MSRDDGFPIADVDVRLLDDGKVRLLWRRLQDPVLMCQAMTIYLAALLASWGAGERVAVTEAAPIWLEPATAVLDALAAVGLLDAEECIPDRVWQGWYGPAHERREAKRAGGRVGGLKAHGIIAQPNPEHSLGNPQAEPDPTVPYRPTRPAVPAVAPARETHPKRSPGTDRTSCPGCGDLLDDKDPNVVVADRGRQLWHRQCPSSLGASA